MLCTIVRVCTWYTGKEKEHLPYTLQNASVSSLIYSNHAPTLVGRCVVLKDIVVSKIRALEKINGWNCGLC